jgi:hypothetical protein
MLVMIFGISISAVRAGVHMQMEVALTLLHQRRVEAHHRS